LDTSVRAQRQQDADVDAGAPRAGTAEARVRLVYHHRVLASDGMRVHIDAIVAVLAAAGHRVCLVGPSGDGRGVSHSLGGLRRRLPGWVSELLEIGYNVPAFVRLWRAVRAERPDAIYERYNLYLLAGLLVAKLTRLPLILEVNAPLVRERRAEGTLALAWLARRAEGLVWRGADAVLPVSQVLAQDVAACGVPAERLQVVPNGADTDLTPDAVAGPGLERRRALGLDDKIVFGFVGFVRPWHGLDRVIDACAELADARLHLLVVGDGPARDDLEAQAARLGVRDQVTFVGRCRHDEIPAYLGSFDVALQPAVTDYASPLKLIEYMATGRAIIAPDSPNIRELVQHEHSACLVPVGAADPLRAAIARLAADGDARRRLGAAARRTVEARPLSWSHNARVIADLAARLHARRGAR
jgi:glycosyltransferase involved in cell wall biosynthesis